MFWMQPLPMWVTTRAVCRSCERYYDARHPWGRQVFHCSHCLTMTGIPIRG